MSESTARNLIVDGGVSLALVGVLSALCYQIYVVVSSWIANHFMVTVTLENNSDAFDWVLDWLSRQPSFMSSKKLTIQLAKRSQKSNSFWNNARTVAPELEFLPGWGLHVLFYGVRPVWFMRVAGETVVSGWDRKPTNSESLQISALGRSPATILDIIKQAREMSVAKFQNRTNIYVLHQWGYRWIRAMSRQPRPLESVILDSSTAKDIINDALNFLKSEEWYQTRGIPHRRGYLLYGPPGAGKTSFVTAVAGALKLHVCVLNLSNKSLTDQGIVQRLHDAPPRSLILLEDVDSVFVKRDFTNSRFQSGVTFSGLLNALDGIGSQEGRLYFLTTNHIEKLDPALIRPGRCDVKILFDYASKQQIRDMFVRFYPNGAEFVDEFVRGCGEVSLSMASLQGHFMNFKGDARAALKNVNLLVAQKAVLQLHTYSLTEWFHRLGLPQYAHAFLRAGLESVEDIKQMREGQLQSQFKITTLGHRKKILAMLEGEESVRLQFATITDMHVVRRIFLEKFLGDEVGADHFCQALAPVWPCRLVSEASLTSFLNSCSTWEDAIRFLPRLTSIESWDTNTSSLSLFVFLRRLGLQHYFHRFTADQLTEVSALNDLNEGDLQKFGMGSAAAKLIVQTLKGELSALSEFRIAKPYDVQQLLASFLPSVSLADCERFAQLWSDPSLTDSQSHSSLSVLEVRYFLMQVLATTKDMATVMQQIMELAPSLLFSRLRLREPSVTTWDIFSAYPDMSLGEFLRRCGFPTDYLSKLNKNLILDLQDFRQVPVGMHSRVGISSMGHIELLSALLAGQPDAVRYFSLASTADLVELFGKHVPHRPDLVGAWLEAVPESTVSLYQVKNYLSEYAAVPELAVLPMHVRKHLLCDTPSQVNPRQPLSEVLHEFKLDHLVDTFASHKFEFVSDIKTITEAELKDKVGVARMGDRKAIMEIVSMLP